MLWYVFGIQSYLLRFGVWMPSVISRSVPLLFFVRLKPLIVFMILESFFLLGGVLMREP